MGQMILGQMSKVTSQFDDQIIKLPDNNTNQLWCVCTDMQHVFEGQKIIDIGLVELK